MFKDCRNYIAMEQSNYIINILKGEYLTWLRETLRHLELPILIQQIAMIAVMTAVTCVLAPLSIPIGPVPISLTNFAIYLSLYLLDWKKGTISYILYLLLGLVGLPVFSGFTGGIGKLAGPTGGYIIGFIPMAIVAGIIIDKFHQRWIQILAMIIGTAICYAFGTAWFCIQAGYTVSAALAVCVIPFIPADLIKMVIAMIIGPEIRKRLGAVAQ